MMYRSGMYRMNCKNCGCTFWACRCERFEIPEVKVHWPPKYKILDKVQIPKNPKYRVVFKNGSFTTESIE